MTDGERDPQSKVVMTAKQRRRARKKANQKAARSRRLSEALEKVTEKINLTTVKPSEQAAANQALAATRKMKNKLRKREEGDA